MLHPSSRFVASPLSLLRQNCSFVMSVEVPWFQLASHQFPLSFYSNKLRQFSQMKEAQLLQAFPVFLYFWHSAFLSPLRMAWVLLRHGRIGNCPHKSSFLFGNCSIDLFSWGCLSSLIPPAHARICIGLCLGTSPSPCTWCRASSWLNLVVRSIPSGCVRICMKRLEDSLLLLKGDTFLSYNMLQQQNSLLFPSPFTWLNQINKKQKDYEAVGRIVSLFGSPSMGFFEFLCHFGWLPPFQLGSWRSWLDWRLEWSTRVAQDHLN